MAPKSHDGTTWMILHHCIHLSIMSSATKSILGKKQPYTHNTHRAHQVLGGSRTAMSAERRRAPVLSSVVVLCRSPFCSPRSGSYIVVEGVIAARFHLKDGVSRFSVWLTALRIDLHLLDFKSLFSIFLPAATLVGIWMLKTLLWEIPFVFCCCLLQHVR
ncbi:hypothetical protein F5Y18DRAFT_199944 [Xylariaceae sp. FL1019]|nr:hypothetical protein F5Y18DRAFT_199944 [Xylariaceae sp. FL1019]